MRLYFYSFFIMILSVITLGCISPTPAEELPEWGYEDEIGPDKWAKLSDAYGLCASGIKQSPVNINTKELERIIEKVPLKFNYGNTKLDIVNNGYTLHYKPVELNYTLEVDNRIYNFVGFDLHKTSEHTIDGEQYPFEIQFIQRYSYDNYVVVSALIKEGAVNKELQNIIDNIPSISDGETESTSEPDVEFNVRNLLPENKDYYMYEGSFTTPPCKEVVHWYVFKSQLTASKKQIETLQKKLKDSYRPIQELQDRTVYEYTVQQH